MGASQRESHRASEVVQVGKGQKHDMVMYKDVHCNVVYQSENGQTI